MIIYLPVVIGLLLRFLMIPSLWPEASAAIHEAMYGNGTSLYDQLIPDYENKIPDLKRQAVSCIDSVPPANADDFPTAEDLADQGLRTLKEVSRHFGVSAGLNEPDGGCQFWPVQGPERYTGPWTASLETPMLIVSNTVRLI